MGLFELFFGNGGKKHNRKSGMSEEYREALREIRKQKSKGYRIVRTAVIMAATLAGVLFVLTVLVSDLRERVWLYELEFVVFALCAGGGMTLPWITQYARDKKRAENGESVAAWRKYVVYAYCGFIGACTLVLVISVFVALGPFIQAWIDKADNYDPSNLFLMLRISTIVTIQAAIGTVVAISTMRFGKNYLALRTIMYVSVAYLDFWVCWFVGGVTIDRLTNGFAPISNTFLWVLAVLMAVALGVAGGLFGRQTRNKEIELYLKGDVKALTEGEIDIEDAEVKSAIDGVSKANEKDKKDPEQQLAKIKELFDKGIITEEEYQAKRKDIIDKL